MALHARICKHYVFRVSKLNKLSHTTQTIDRSCDKSVAYNVSVQPSQDLLALMAASSYQHHLLSSQRKTSSMSTVHHHNFSTNDKVTISETGLTAALHFPQDFLPFEVMSVSYPAGNFTKRPVEKKSLVKECGVKSSESHTSSVQTNYENNVQCAISKNLDSGNTVPFNVTADGCVSPSKKPCVRRKTVCDSNPARYESKLVDYSPLLPSSIGPGSETVFCSSGSGSGSDSLQCSGGPGKEPTEGQGPSFDQLKSVEKYFIETLPKFFKTRLDYRVYHPAIVFENNFWGENKVSVGVNQYAMEMIKMRALTHFKYAHVHMEIISSVCMPEDSSIHIKWRIVGLSQFKALRFWKYSIWNYSKSFREDAEWLDGVSTLHVDKDGLVFKHRLDRVTPDEGQVAKQPSLAAKLALLFGLSAPKPGLTDFNSLLCKR